MCSNEFGDAKIIISHLKIDHIVKSNIIEMKCLVKGNSCENGFYKFEQLKNHLKKCSVKRKICELDIEQNLEKESAVKSNIDISSKMVQEKHVVSQTNTESDGGNSFSVDEFAQSFGSLDDNNQFTLNDGQLNAFGEVSMNFLDSFNKTICNFKPRWHDKELYKNMLSYLQSINKPRPLVL